jgi:hypothetical protein
LIPASVAVAWLVTKSAKASEAKGGNFPLVEALLGDFSEADLGVCGLREKKLMIDEGEEADEVNAGAMDG